MVLRINWDKPVLGENEVLQIQPDHLDEFYITASEGDKPNLFFVLLTSFHYYLDAKESEKAAHLSFLMAYYLFIPLTPPGSYDLAIHYINTAIALNPLETYQQWLLLIKKGN